MPLILETSLIWLRVALGLYLTGLALALAAAWWRRASYFGLARAAIAAGFLFHLVSLVESGWAMRFGAVTVYREITGLLAFVVGAFFLMVYRIYSPKALSLLVVPLMCLLTAASAFAPVGPAAATMTMAGGSLNSPQTKSLLHNPWILVHVILICLGYAGLILAVASGVLYLIAEHALKSKRAPLGGPRLLPSLETLDLIGYRSLLAGFPMLTVGLIIGTYWGEALFGGNRMLSDPTVLLALAAWAFFLVLLFARWSSGWRGRRSAYLALVCFGIAIAGWLVNGHSLMHSLFLPQ